MLEDKFVPEWREKLLQASLLWTAAWKKRHAELLRKAVPPTELTGKAKQVADYLAKTEFGCAKKSIAGLLSIILDVDLSRPDIIGVEHKVLAAVVPILDQGSGLFPAGIAIVCLSAGGTYLNRAGDYTNNATQVPNSVTDCRAATVEEVKEFFAKCEGKTIDIMKSNVSSVLIDVAIAAMEAVAVR